ncbi:MAG TPA: PAS domain-containing protein [Gemmatimonadales bacterium]|nr:PAS domain-containing protein [Gemmatimonadales bacterium]
MSETSEYPTSVELLAAVLDALPVGVWIMDREGRITHGNPAGRRIWGGARYVGPEQFGDYKGWWTDTGKRIEPNEWAAARAVQKGETSLDEVIDIECFDGSRKTILNSALPVRGPDGSIVGAIIVNQDISLRRKAELERERLLKRLQDAQEQVHTLAGLLPICAGCKRIRDEKNEWQSVESYIADRSTATFSHGLCPECSQRLYPHLLQGPR